MENDPKLDADIRVAARSSDQLAMAYAVLQVVKAVHEAKLDPAALHAIAKEIREGTERIAQAIRKEKE